MSQEKNCKNCLLFVGVGKDDIAGMCPVRNNRAFSSAYFKEYAENCEDYFT